MEEKIEKLDGYPLDTGKKGYYDSQESDMNDIKITENNMTLVVNKMNEIIDKINNLTP
jgi:hypothetical protein